MRRGDFAAAWEISDIVLQSRVGKPCTDLPRYMQWVWNGESLARKRVLIRCYHGLGDTIQFIRYAPLVKGIAKEVTVQAQPELLPLLGTMSGIDCLVPYDIAATELCHDVDVEAMELPHIFRTTLQSIPAEIPYLRAERVSSANHNLAVGVVWSAGDWDPERSIPASLLTPLAAVSGVELHVFQVGSALAERRDWKAVIPEWTDLAEEAALIRGLNLMISVDSMPAHLAGALGTPVWLLLKREADWRWLEGREDSPWYPTMRLFRQTRAGEWEAVIARVTSELERLSRNGLQHRAYGI